MHNHKLTYCITTILTTSNTKIHHIRIPTYIHALTINPRIFQTKINRKLLNLTKQPIQLHSQRHPHMQQHTH